MPTNQQLAEQAIREYQTLLRQNGGVPAGLDLTAQINLSAARDRIKTAETVTQADIDHFRRQVLVNEIAKGRTNNQFPDKFFPREVTGLAEHLDQRLTFDQQDIIRRGDIRAQAHATGQPDPLRPGTLAANAPLLNAEIRETLDDATRATFEQQQRAAELRAMVKSEDARDLARAAEEADGVARRVLEGIARDVAATRTPAGVVPPNLSAPPSAAEADEFAAMLRNTRFTPTAASTATFSGDTEFLARQAAQVAPPPAAVPPAVPEAPHAPVAPHTPTAPHAPGQPHVATKGPKGGIVTGLAIAAGVGIASMANGATPASAAVTARDVAVEGLVPGATTGFSGITGPNVGAIERALNIADTATGTVATGAAVAALVPGTQAVAIPTAAIAGTANVGVGLLRDAAFVTGLDDQGGIITAGVHAVMDANAQRALVAKTTEALQAGRTAPGTERIADLRDSYNLQVQQIRALDQYDPNHRDNLRRQVQAPPPYKDPLTGQTLTNLRDIRAAMSHQASQLQHQYAQAIVETARDNPRAIAQLTGDPAAVPPAAAPPAAPPAAAPSVVAQFGANMTAATDPNLSTKQAPPAVNIPGIAAATEKKPEAAPVPVAAVTPTATAPRPSA